MCLLIECAFRKQEARMRQVIERQLLLLALQILRLADRRGVRSQTCGRVFSQDSQVVGRLIESYFHRRDMWICDLSVISQRAVMCSFYTQDKAAGTEQQKQQKT